MSNAFSDSLVPEAQCDGVMMVVIRHVHQGRNAATMNIDAGDTTFANVAKTAFERLHAADSQGAKEAPKHCNVGHTREAAA